VKTFITDDFLLNSEPARRLYHEYAEDMPIFDYHCHLNPQEIYEDKQFSDIGEAWLAGDHYKWRGVRTWGGPAGEAPCRKPPYRQPKSVCARS